MKIILIIFVLLFTVPSFSKNHIKIHGPSEQKSNSYNILITKIVDSYNLANKKKDPFYFFFTYTRKQFDLKLTREEIKRITYFLTQTTKISYLRRCTNNEKEVSLKPKSTLCADIIVGNNGKRVAFFTINEKNKQISDIRVF